MKPTATVKNPEEIRREIEAILHEGMGNIIMVCLGENLKSEFSYVELQSDKPGAGLWLVTAMTEYLGRPFTVTAEVPIRFADQTVCATRIDDKVFTVLIDDYANAFGYEAWCEHDSTHEGSAVIVRETTTSLRLYDRWLVGHSEPGVLYRGKFEHLALPWARDVIAVCWPLLPYMALDTEQAMAKHIQ